MQVEQQISRFDYHQLVAVCRRMLREHACCSLKETSRSEMILPSEELYFFAACDNRFNRSFEATLKQLLMKASKHLHRHGKGRLDTLRSASIEGRPHDTHTHTHTHKHDLTNCFLFKRCLYVSLGPRLRFATFGPHYLQRKLGSRPADSNTLQTIFGFGMQKRI